MPSGGLKDVRVVSAVFAVTIVLTIATALITPAEGPAANAPTSFSNAPAGGKAAFLTLRALGYRVERSYEPMTHVRAEPKRTVLLVSGGGAPSGQDTRAMLAFVASGGIALVTGAAGAEFLGITGLERSAFIGPVVTHRVLLPSPLTARVTEITMPGPGQPVDFDEQYVSVFAQAEEQPLVATATIGGGRIVWMAAPTPLMNDQIDRADNLQLLLNVVGPVEARQILWDEHYHGYTRSLWSYAVNTPLPWMAVQAALIAACALIAFGRRSTPVRPRREIARTSPLEFIDVLSTLYRRSNAGSAAVIAARSRFFRAVLSVCGIASAAGGGVIARAVAARLGIDQDRVEDTLRASAAAAGGRAVDARTALSMSRDLQDLTARLYDLRTAPKSVSAVQEP